MKLRTRALALILIATLTLSVPIAVWAGKDVYAPLKRFSQILDLVEDHYVRAVDRDELLDGAIKGMILQLDPHSAYMNAEDFSEMQINTSGAFGGVGIEISIENGRLTVISPIEDTPAFKAGLKAGDVILEIDGEPTQDISLTEAVKKIRGPRGSDVVLTILHKNGSKPIKVSITRDTIPIKSVKSEILDNGMLYLRLTRFNENTTSEMHKVIRRTVRQGPIKGLVLDLRNNPGGLLDQAVAVADTFLRQGNIVYIQGRDAQSRKDFNAVPASTDVDAPMVVLINAGSASASEIVAGALQDHKRALILGEKSFGKATVQTIIPLADGSGIKLTTALYYTPSGRSIQAEGITPSIIYPFEEPREDNGASHRTLRERDLTGHIEVDNGTGAASRGRSQKAQDMLDRDNQLRLALQLVKKLPSLKLLQ